MFCQNCGREIQDGTVFCPFCGKPTSAGAAAQPGGGQPAQGYPGGVQPAQGYPQGGYPGGYGYPQPPRPMNPVFSDAVSLFVKSFKKPMSVVNDVIKQNKSVAGLLLVILELLLAFVTIWIHVPVGEYSDEFSSSLRAKLGMYFMLALAVVIILNVIGAFIVKPKNNPAFSFMNVLGAFGAACVPASVGIVLIFILGIMSPTPAFIAGVFSICIWSSLTSQIIYTIAAGDKNSRTVKTYIVKVCIMAIIMFIMYLLINHAKNSALDYISDLFGGFLF